jgi:hypothetical protein
LLVEDAPWVLKVPLELSPENLLLHHPLFHFLLRDVMPESPGKLDVVLLRVLSLAKFRTAADNGLTSRTVLLLRTTTPSTTEVLLTTTLTTLETTTTVALSPELNSLACTNLTAVLTSKLNALLVD